MIKRYLYPDYYFDDIYEITPALLRKHNIKGLICDIDNTLEPYENPLPSERLTEWINEMTNNGISIAFVSNNNNERVALFNRDLGFYAVGKSGKPSRKHLIKAMEHMKTDVTSTAMIGDQLFTDIFAGKRLRLFSILVKPINDKRTLFFRIKRYFERIILKGYKHDR
jgi:HAD superfamily (subfamily IIIA) phosphatase, TIGR01668